MVGLEISIKLLWDPFVKDNPLEANSKVLRVGHEALTIAHYRLSVARWASEVFDHLLGKRGLEARVEGHWGAGFGA